MDDLAQIDGDLSYAASCSSVACSIEASMSIDLCDSFVNLNLFLLEAGVLITLFYSCSCHSVSLYEYDTDSLSQSLHVS